MGTNYLPLFEDVDVIQVGARNMQNFDLLRELGKLRKPILLKRGLASTLKELLMSAEYIMAGGNEQVILCERGIRTYDDYMRNTLDLAAVPMLKSSRTCRSSSTPATRPALRASCARWHWLLPPAALTASSSRCTTTPFMRCATARNPCAPSSTMTSPKAVRRVRGGGRMTAGIVGLGLIGGSLAKAYHGRASVCSPTTSTAMSCRSPSSAARWTRR